MSGSEWTFFDDFGVRSKTRDKNVKNRLAKKRTKRFFIGFYSDGFDQISKDSRQPKRKKRFFSFNTVFTFCRSLSVSGVFIVFVFNVVSGFYVLLSFLTFSRFTVFLSVFRFSLVC